MIEYCRNVPRYKHLCIVAEPSANPANLAHRQLYPFHEMQPIKSNFTFITKVTLKLNQKVKHD